MPDIRHHLGINAPQAAVHQALATRAGVAGWWTTTVTGDDEVGGKLAFYFGGPDPSAVMEIVDLSPDRVEWRCVEGPDEWVDTTLTFELKHNDGAARWPEGRHPHPDTDATGETEVMFTHGGWREQVPFMAHCSLKWAQFLLSLKAGFEGGDLIPFPNDPPISSWG